jgi:pimeloyl-ACP methyl ester carboxylesterase
VVGDRRFDEAVDDFMRAYAVPRRLREPRVADRLKDVERADVRCKHGCVAAWRLGEGPAVLLVHGYEDDNSLWSPLIDVLADAGRAVVAFDAPAHGASEGEWGLGWETADAIHAVREALGPVDAVVAHSVGCGGVLGAMTEGFEVDRAVFVAPTPLGIKATGTNDRWHRYADRLGTPEDVVLAARAHYEESIGPTRAAFDGQGALASIGAELLVVHSTDDERMAYEGACSVVEAASSATLVTVHGLTHRSTARDPEVVRQIAAFLTSG